MLEGLVDDVVDEVIMSRMVRQLEISQTLEVSEI